MVGKHVFAFSNNSCIANSTTVERSIKASKDAHELGVESVATVESYSYLDTLVRRLRCLRSISQRDTMLTIGFLDIVSAPLETFINIILN